MKIESLNPIARLKNLKLPFIALALLSLFVFTHVWALVSIDSLYWDDWAVLTQEPESVKRMFKFTGFELLGIFHAWFAPFGAGAYKVLMLLGVAIISASTFYILRQYGFKESEASWITALLMVAPLNSSKIAAINVPAIIFAACFFLAWICILRDLSKPAIHWRISALLLFSVAFYYPASLAFFALPAGSIGWHAYRSSSCWRNRFKMLSKRADFLLLPFIQFAIFRLVFFKPDVSIADEYHRFGIRSSRLQEAWERILVDITIDMPWAIRIALVALISLILLRIIKHSSGQENISLRRADLWMCIGISACFFALLPFLAVGRLPTFSDWNSRYHLFLPLGFALISWSMSRYIAFYTRRGWLGHGLFAGLLICSTASTINSYFEYAEDWKKQNQLIEVLGKQTFASQTDNVIFVDSVSYAKRRKIRDFEYTKMLMQAQPLWNGIAMSHSQLHPGQGASLSNYMAKSGRLNSIQADPKLYGLSSMWHWTDSCVVLVVSELAGKVRVNQLEDSIARLQPCVLPPDLVSPKTDK